MNQKALEKRKSRAKQKTEGQIVGLGAAICLLRLQRQMTRRVLADKCDLSINFIYRMERDNRRPSSDSLGRLCRALGITANELNRVAEANISPVEMRVFQIVKQLEEMSDQPGIRDAVNALSRSFPLP